MRRFKVGGATRDQLLGRPTRDCDWLVLEASEDELLAKGYQKVGKAFPIYLHPETNEEYSFPRAANTSDDPIASVIADLCHRDLTINAIAEDENGELIDPLSGASDIQHRLLRHTPAYAEDPLRVFRTFRLLAELSPYQFSIAPETEGLIKELVSQGALNNVPKERVWAELNKALMSSDPPLFFQSMHNAGVLEVIMPELDRLFGVPQPATYHPEIDTGVHALLSLKTACDLTDNVGIRLASLIHDLGKGLTPRDEWPRHRGHEKRGIEPIRRLCQRMGVNKRDTRLALLVGEYHMHCHRIMELKPSTILHLLQKLDSFRKPDRFNQFLLACEADAKGRTGLETSPYPQAKHFSQLALAAKNVDLSNLQLEVKSPKQRMELVNRARVNAISTAKRHLLGNPE